MEHAQRDTNRTVSIYSHMIVLILILMEHAQRVLQKYMKLKK